MAITATISHPESLYIGGKWVAPAGKTFIDVTNCATEELFARVAEAGERDMLRAVAAARNAFDHGPWPRMRPQERAAYLKALAAELDAQAEAMALWYVEGKLKLDGYISHRLPLERINEGFELMRAGKTARAIVVYD